MKRLLLTLSALLLLACGPSAPPTDTDTTQTSGGEYIENHPMRTTTPVPVPEPAVAREEMSEPLQRFWTQIEETVAIRPPEGPAEATTEAVEAWANGPFSDWIQRRRAATSAAIATIAEIPEDPPHERGVAAALLGYALEDFVADVRGSPVPEEISQDAELLQVYISNLQEVLRPLATESVGAYGSCQQRFAPLGDESEWLPWRAYCVQRGQEIIEVFELAPPEPDTQEPSAPPAS